MEINPLDWMKNIYGWLGVPYPRASLAFAVILGSLFGGSIWKFAGYVYAKGHPATVSGGSAATLGDCSSAVNGNGNTVQVSCDPPKQTK